MEIDDRSTEELLRSDLWEARADNYKLLAEVGVLKKQLATSEAECLRLQEELGHGRDERVKLREQQVQECEHYDEQLATAHGLLREAADYIKQLRQKLTAAESVIDNGIPKEERLIELETQLAEAEARVRELEQARDSALAKFMEYED